VAAQNGFTSDVHEFLLTPNNTALFLATKVVPMDLTPYGGPQNGFVNDFAVQEVDLRTNQLLFIWDALDHIPLTDSFEPASTATSSSDIWDAFHLNSVGLTDNLDEILVSGRNTWTVYKVHKPSGHILWRLGGKNSSFTILSGAEFSWQHDARFLPTNVISLFDDNCCENPSVVPPGTPFAHGLILQLDLNAMTATPLTTYYHSPNINVASQGNVQSLPNGNKFIGWGQSQFFSEYAPAGNSVGTPSMSLLYDAQMPGSNISYRAYKSPWVGLPSYPPSVAVSSTNGQTTIYASWNGSTETAIWQVFAGNNPKALTFVASAFKSGFETSITVPVAGPYFLVKALNSSGEVLGESALVTSP
jgi:arylsulfotransferase ASST